MAKKLLFVFILMAALEYSLDASDYAYSGVTGVHILQLNPYSRPIAMGGAYTAVSNDAAALFHNPAGLGLVNHIEIPFALNNIVGSIRHESLGFVTNMPEMVAGNLADPGTIAISWSAIDSGNIPGRSAAGAYTGDFKARNRVITASYGRKMFDSQYYGAFYSGVSVKAYKEEMFDNHSEGEAYDAGILWKWPEQQIYLGAVYQNFGAKAKYVTDKFELPSRMSIGLSRRLIEESLILAMDLSKPKYMDFMLKFGLEYWHEKILAFRIGYDTENKQGNGVSAGLGLSLKEFDVFFFYGRELTVDYSFVYYDFIENMHRLSLNLKLGAD